MVDSKSQQVNENETLPLLAALKKQSIELEKRGLIIMRLDEELSEYKKYVLAIVAENKKLEALLHSLKEERKKFLEENTALEEQLKKPKDVALV